MSNEKTKCSKFRTKTAEQHGSLFRCLTADFKQLFSPINVASDRVSKKHLFNVDDTDIKTKFKKTFAAVMESAKNHFLWMRNDIQSFLFSQ